MSSETSPSAAESNEASTPDVAASTPTAGEPVAYRVGDVVQPSQIRRAPRFGRFIFAGVFLGALLAGILMVLTSGSDLTDRDLLGLLLLVCVPVFALLGALVAVVLDRRSVRKYQRSQQQTRP